MKNVVGPPARGTSFFPREREVAKIMSRIEAGNNLQIAAPRRVGKTSILFYLLDKSIKGYTYVYLDTEHVDNEQDFFKKIIKEILKESKVAKSGLLQNLLKAGKGIFGKIKSINILGNELSFNEATTEVDYREELLNFLAGFELEEANKLILLLDEFPQTILNIVAANNGDTRAAIQFLQSNRELRQHPEINPKVQFIYTGSIGLNHTVAAIDGAAFVNDLNSVEVEPLSKEEAIQLVKQLLQEKNIIIDPEALTHLLDKIEWFIPFHIQLAVQEIIDLAHQTGHADINIINTAFDKIIEARNNNHFQHYYSRLRSQFKGNAFKYVDDLLQQLAVSGTLSKAHLQDLSIKHAQEATYRQILEMLAYDGYINNIGNSNTFRFNSPILRQWWQKFI